MKFCVAQTRPVKGDIHHNVINHKALIDLAVAEQADVIIFPELSITGYEPDLAKDLATSKDDARFDDFQNISNTKNIVIGIGAPVKSNNGINIGLVIFQPNKARALYSKKYLHADEVPYFSNGQNYIDIRINDTLIAFAICYEISIPAHAENAFRSGAKIYIASVAKSVTGVVKASDTLAEIASTYSMTVLMANSVGPSDNFIGGGKSSIWNNDGSLMQQLDDASEGILILDTDAASVSKKML